MGRITKTECVSFSLDLRRPADSSGWPTTERTEGLHNRKTMIQQKEASKKPANTPIGDLGATYWITGLPGAGKTSVGYLLWRRLRMEGRFALFLDGDRLRTVLGGTCGHSLSERLALAKSYALLCQELSRQGADVVCSTVSMFENVRQWNRAHLPNYYEIYLRVPIEVLRQRNQKGLYAGATSGRLADVPGVTQAFEEPQAPDLVIDNDGARTPQAIADQLYRAWLTARGGH